MDVEIVRRAGYDINIESKKLNFIKVGLIV